MVGNELNSAPIMEHLYANPKRMLQELFLSLSAVDHDMVHVIAPSLHRLQSLLVCVDEVRCDGLSNLFEACPNVKAVRFIVRNYDVVQDALDSIALLIQVAYTKTHLRSLFITCEVADSEWDECVRVQFARDMTSIVQKMRLERCSVEIFGRLSSNRR